MTFSSSLKHTLSCAAIAVGAITASMPAAADPVDWASWSGIVTSNTNTGSALATFADVGITANYSGELRSFVPNYPSYTPIATFSGGTVSNGPAQADGIVQIFGGTPTGTHTITFSEAVLNPVLAIWSLGQPGTFLAQFVFGQSFTIQSGGANAEFGGAAITAVGNTVSGAEGNGVIQFDGSLTSITWTNPIVENWYGFTVGVPVAVIPEPETYALMLAGLALLGARARRRRAA